MISVWSRSKGSILLWHGKRIPYILTNFYGLWNNKDFKRLSFIADATQYSGCIARTDCSGEEQKEKKSCLCCRAMLAIRIIRKFTSSQFQLEIRRSILTSKHLEQLLSGSWVGQTRSLVSLWVSWNDRITHENRELPQWLRLDLCSLPQLIMIEWVKVHFYHRKLM